MTLPRTLIGTMAAGLLLLGGCSGGDEEAAVSPEDALAEAKVKLDETSGVALSLTTDELPDGVDAILTATGVGTHAPAFEGDLTMQINNLSVDVPVVAVDGTVYARLPFTTEFSEINPADYGAPDPASLMDTKNGLSGWLTALEGVEEGDQVRLGDQVLTSYSGTLPGSVVADVIPSASKDASFDTTFRIDDDGYLASADVAGPFYGDVGDVDYTIKVSDYGNDQDITRP